MSNITSVKLTNNSGQEVTVWLTLGATPGCVQNVADIPFVTNPAEPLKGNFTLANGKSVSYATPEGKGINGTFTFNSPPSNCPDWSQFPNGVNQAEFILNNGFQTGIPQESINISNVPGCNAILNYAMSGGGAWNAGGAHPNLTSFENKSIGENIGVVGVYPYGCDKCTISDSPPVCTNGRPKNAPNPIVVQQDAICQVQRDASGSGGEVHITLKRML